MIKNLPQTDKQYYLIIGERHLYAKARMLNLTAAYSSEDYPDDNMIALAKKTGKSILFVKFDTSDENEGNFCSTRRFNDSDCKIIFYNIYGMETEDGHKIKTLEDAAESLAKIIDSMVSQLIDFGFIKSTDYSGRCGCCHQRIRANDNYCRYCGTKRGEGEFEPYFNIVCCVYGPPIQTKYECEVCGKSWMRTLWGGEHAKYCPQCGSDRIMNCRERTMEFFEFPDDDYE